MILSLLAAVAASVLYAASTIMQAVATRRAHGLAAVAQPLVIGGLVVDGVAWLLSLLALDHLPLFVVQAVVAASLVVVVLLARLVLGATTACTTNSGRWSRASSERSHATPSTTSPPITSGCATTARPCARRVATACMIVLTAYRTLAATAASRDRITRPRPQVPPVRPSSRQERPLPGRRPPRAGTGRSRGSP